MLKKALSMFLCIVICISCFSITGVEAAAYDVKSIFAITSSPVKENTLRYTVNITAEQKDIAGTVIYIQYDSTVLEPVFCEPAVTSNATSGTTQNFEGTFIHGVTEENENMYSVAYMNTVAVSTGKTAKAFFSIIFEVIDLTKPKTDVTFYCKEYYSTSETDKNISVEDGLQVISEYKNISTLEAPVLTSIKPATDGFTIAWEPVVGAIGYAIYRSSPSTSRENVGETVGADSTVFTDTGLKSGVNYTYTVTAVNNYGESAYDSVGISAMYIAKPQISSVVNVVGGVEIRWTATDGADRYDILRRVVGEAQWTKLSSRPASLDTVYKDINVTDGVEYEYDVNSATDTFESVSAQIGQNIIYIKAPAIISVTNNLDGVEIKWNAHPKATSYIVYRRAIGVDEGLVEYFATNKTEFTDTNVEAGKAYTYSVKACTVTGDSAYNKTGYTITCVPSASVTSIDVGKDSLTPHWDEVPGADGYVVYRKYASEEGWVKVATVAKTVFSFKDTMVVSGTRYQYAVCPLVANSEGAKVPSNSVYFIKAPGNVVAENIDNGINLTWDKVGGADTYNVFRKEADGNFIQIATTQVNSFLDLNVEFNVEYTYSVVAISHSGSSEISDSNKLMRLSAIGKATPVLNEEGGIKITWDASPIAESYALFKFNGTQWLFTAKVEGTEYIDTELKSNEMYSYAVAQMIGDSIGILNTRDAIYIRYIAPVGSIGVTNYGTYARLTWSAVDGATQYYIYKSSAVDGEYSLIGTVSSAKLLQFDDKNVINGKECFYAIRCYNGESMSSLSEPKSNMFMRIPQISSVSNIYGGQQVSWSAVEGAERYVVYCKSPSSNGYKIIATVGADELTFINKKAENGVSNTYAIRAVNGDAVSYFKGKSAVYLTAPTVTLSNAGSGMTIKWNKIDSATSYKVYRRTAGKGWTLITTVGTTSYIDKTAKSGVYYAYTVRSCNTKATSGFYKGWTMYRLEAPVLKSASNGYGNVTFKWNKVSGASGYAVYRKADREKTWTLVGKTTGTVFYDKEVDSRSVYRYTVRALKGTSLSSFYSSGKATTYIEAPKLTVQNSTSGIYLSWNRISGAGSYYIYRKAGNEKSWKQIEIVTGNSYMDLNVTPGVVYTYTIRAYGSKVLSGFYSSGWKMMYIKTPELVSAKSTSSGVKFTWKKVSMATSYAVYRKADREKTWTLVGTVKGNGKVTFTDKNVEYGETYTYTVRAVNGSYKSWFKSGTTCVHKN